MLHTKGRIALIAFLVVVSSLAESQNVHKPSPAIPRTWDDAAVSSMELPLPGGAPLTKHISSDYYYRMPVRPVYKTYPIYRPDREPPDYLAMLKKEDPQILFDSSKFQTEQDWIRAGKLVFEAPIEFVPASDILFSEVRDPQWYGRNQVQVTREGILPNFQYVIREKGNVEIGILACSGCHTRVMPDGSSIEGAQGNFPDDRTFGYEESLEAKNTKDKDEILSKLRRFMKKNYALPWAKNDLNARPDHMTLEEIVGTLEAIPPGTCARQGASIFYPVKIPDLIGVKERRYLDASGRIQHRDIGDLMRYAALNQGADLLASYGGWIPRGSLPDPSSESRYSDEQLYALALYVYSLTPPHNPNRFDALASRGKEVFDHAGCFVCHPGPLYTNNKLIPDAQFDVPDAHMKLYDIINMPVGTDPNLTLNTRRGSGYYKVPSLKGVWYRGPFGHNGSVATLEDWLDPRRLHEDYVPSGFRGYAVSAHSVKGHTFGLSLSADERKALIAFLKTL